MTAQPDTLKAIRYPEAPELSELSALALIWGLARAITEAPPASRWRWNCIRCSTSYDASG